MTILSRHSVNGTLPVPGASPESRESGSGTGPARHVMMQAWIGFVLGGGDRFRAPLRADGGDRALLSRARVLPRCSFVHMIAYGSGCNLRFTAQRLEMTSAKSQGSALPIILQA